jgi:DNA polymerase bacteriophage-type
MQWRTTTRNPLLLCSTNLPNTNRGAFAGAPYFWSEKMRLSGDFETYSDLDLTAVGLHNYATHKSTGIHCFSFGFSQDDIQTWHEGEPFPEVVREHIANGGIFTAWNAAFEIALWNECATKKCGWPVLPVEQVRCSMAAAYAMGLPGKLENAAPALGLEQRKDMAGKRIMLQLAQPREDGTFWRVWDDPEKFERLYSYNRQDVRTEMGVLARIMELSPAEQDIWQLDYKINQRGIMVDLPSIDRAIRLVDQEQQRLNADMLRVTGGVVGKCSEVQMLVKWIRSQGVEIKGVAKADVLDALADETLPGNVAAALQLRKEAAKSSTAKLVAMRERASSDGRVRNLHQYHGAATGRWAGRGIQVQNFPRTRPDIKPEAVVDIITNLANRDYIDLMYGPCMDALADSLRGMLMAAPGHDLVAVDFSAIEARVLAWLAGEEKVLEIFRTHGKIYEHAAAGIYHVPMDEVTKAQRQIGKVAVLALGYGGGVGAFQSMARNYNVKVPDAEADQIKVAWRDSHRKIVQYWYALESASIAAVQEGGKFTAGAAGREVTFLKNGSFLWCRLPSGRALCYPYPEIRTVQTPWGDLKEALTYMTELDSSQRKSTKVLDDPAAHGSWQRISTYGGSFAENVTQAASRDLLASALLRFSQRGVNVTMHCHDEAVCEIQKGSMTVKDAEQLMCVLPEWAAGLPVGAEGWIGPRYRK